tara:strand:- start:769 stop:1032 length:264 start_codon:yes stop_codon:yes gene_type:complete
MLEIAILPNCPWYNQVLKSLNNLNYTHTVKTVINAGVFAQIQALSGIRSFPRLFIDGNFMGGYDELTSLHSSSELEALRRTKILLDA